MTQRSFSAEDFEGDDGVTEPDVKDEPKGEGDGVTEPEPFTYGDDAPEYLRGKTAEDAAAMLAQAGQTIQALQQQRATPPAPAQPEPEPPQLPTFEAEDLMDGNEERFQQKLGQFFDAKAGPYMDEVNKQMATSAYLQAMNDPFFQRFKPEVDEMVSKMPTQQVSNPQTWALIKSHLTDRHFDVLSKEHVEATAKASPGFIAKPKGIGETPKGSDSLTAEERKICRQLGIDPKLYLVQKKRMEV
jgi:hypothetical protein